MALVALLLSACTAPWSHTGTPEPTATHAGSSALAWGACPFALGGHFVAGKNVRCGALTVPEDRSNPSGAKIHLAVAVFKTPSVTPAPDPIIFLQGGPGGRIVQDVAQVIVAGQMSLTGQFGNHDLILVDQRGTGYSTPSLQCPEVVQLQFQTSVNLTPQQQVDAQNQALAACHNRLVSQGINLSAYTTYNDANDIHDLITALGYAQVDLYAVSYGTRLALEMMRSFPQHLRSVVLDSSVPPQLRLLAAVPAATARVFNTLFAGCAAEPACAASYPDLQSVFYALVPQLNANPATFQTTDATTGKGYTVVFHGDDLVNLLFTSFYVTQAIAQLPKMIYQVKAGNYQVASLLWGALMYDDSVAYGDYYSVECAEDVNTETPAQVAAAGQAYPAAIRPDQVLSLESEIPQCQNWHVTTAPASESAPVTSDIPTLVMESEYDPITPPSNGDLVAQGLSHSYKVLFPGVGHGAFIFNACPADVAVSFWAVPTRQPDEACVANMGEPAFA
ncbi:MAG TPA: alpha/beta fold hydrolase [Ktedonobacterales bacterium]|nr:alpha/beta fold hydrolase [Ktedonobacterales bacterium]